MRIFRLDPKSGRKFEAAKDKEGLFVLGSPDMGSQKHHAKNKIRVATEDEAIALLRLGYSIRVKTEKAPSLVRKNLWIDGAQVT